MARQLVYAEARGRISDHPYLELVGRTGRSFCRIPPAELIPLPPGSDLFVLPGRRPVGYDPRRRCLVMAGERQDLPAGAQAPLPTSPICNARYLGYPSHQTQSVFPVAMRRITLIPSPLSHLSQRQRPARRNGGTNQAYCSDQH